MASRLVGRQCLNPECLAFFEESHFFGKNGRPFRCVSFCPKCKQRKLKRKFEEISLKEMPIPYSVQDESIIKGENSKAANDLLLNATLAEFSLLVVS